MITNPHPERGSNYTEKVLPFFMIKADESLGQVTAIVSVFGVIDDGRDRIYAGSFVKTISEFAGRVRVLDQHNTDSTGRVLGRPIAMEEVGADELPPEVRAKFPSATGGLKTVTQYNMKTQAGAEAFYRIQAGDINEYSIGFNALDTDTELVLVDGKKITVRNIRTIKLWEFSPVIWGMNPATATVDAKAGDKPMPAANHKDYQMPETEMQESTEGEPVTLLGDKIHACLASCVTNILTYLYEDGWLSFEEFTKLQTDGQGAITEFRAGMSPDITGREYERQFYYMLMNGDPTDQKSGTPIEVSPPPTEPPPSEEDIKPVKPANADAGQEPEAPAGPPPAEEAPTDPRAILLSRAANLDTKLRLIGGR